MCRSTHTLIERGRRSPSSSNTNTEIRVLRFVAVEDSERVPKSALEITATLRQPRAHEVAQRLPGVVTLTWTMIDGTTGRCALEPRQGSRRVHVGRRAPADLVIDHHSISALHFELELTATETVLRDLGSTNGTWLYGARVREVVIPSGAPFVAGAATFTIEHVREVDVAATTIARFEGITGASAAMQALYSVIDRVAATPLHVVLHGATGTGKELCARALHSRSPRASGPFIVFDCACIPRDLADAAVRGHAAGAFTGASTARSGVFEDANGGTLLLDEIGELPLELQQRLLRVLESREVQRIGETKPRPVDVRVVAATHRDLREMVAAGSFREDLYYRLAQFVIELPPLRERVDDIVLLAREFLSVFSTGFEDPRDLTDAAVAKLRVHPWPGNVRELRNVIMRAAQICPRAVIDAHDLEVASHEIRALAATTPREQELAPLPLEHERENFERSYLLRLLAHTGNNIAAAARVANISRRGLYGMIDRLGIEVRRDDD